GLALLLWEGRFAQYFAQKRDRFGLILRQKAHAQRGAFDAGAFGMAQSEIIERVREFARGMFFGAFEERIRHEIREAQLPHGIVLRSNREAQRPGHAFASRPILAGDTQAVCERHIEGISRSFLGSHRALSRVALILSWWGRHSCLPARLLS